jgi:hypothetical protein
VQAMNDAIAAILDAAGFDVKQGADDYRHPMVLLVELNPCFKPKYVRHPAAVSPAALEACQRPERPFCAACAVPRREPLRVMVCLACPRDSPRAGRVDTRYHRPP